MANLKQSKKRSKQDKKKFLRNKSGLSRVKTFMKKFSIFIRESRSDLALINYPFLISEIDKSVKKGFYHKNKANRLKSLFHKKLKSISGM